MSPAYTAQDNGNNSEIRPRTPHISQDRDPEVEILGPPSSSRRRKTRRRTMGMERPDYINKGNDPFDYEQRFPEDKQSAELGSAARVWRIYLEECVASDGEMVEGWRDGLDVLLVFAGLFSAVVSTFVAQTSQSLHVDYGEVTASLLIELINVQRSSSNGSLVNDVPRANLTFHPSTSDSWVNGLWFISLSLSLTAALFAVLTKQWIHQYLSVPSGTPRDRCHVRQFRYMGLEQWRVGLIVGLLPALMSTSLAAFLVGLVLFIIPLRASIASIVGAIALVSFSAYVVTNFLPVIYPSCPYKTPLSQYMFPIYAYIRRRITRSSTARTLRDAESTAVRDSADDMDVQALIWLINMSSNPSVENIVIESTSAVPLKSLDSFERGVQHTNVGLACTQSLRPLFLEPDVSAHESKVDRLIRARLRFTYSLYNPNIPDMPTPAKDRLSSTLYVDLLCIHPGCDEEIRELLLSNLMTSDDDRTALHLQPIIWARLLARVSMSDSSPDALAVMQMLFTEIPSSYWKADYVPITYALDTLQMKLPSGSDDGDVTLRVAIKKSLYIFVAEDILSWHMRFEPPIICRNYKNDLFENFYPYSRLRLLLSMAGSRSMRSMADSHMQSIPDSYFKQSMTGKHLGRNIPSSSFAHNRSLFITIIESIGELVDIESPHEDNDNRRTVLEFLHALITSVEFDDSLTLREQRSALMMFFRVLNSTSCRPPFLEKDWCTPRLATKSVQIALRDFDSPTHELGTYFFQHTSFTNETLVSFVSTLFEELPPQINVSALWRFLRLIITGLGSEYLVHVSLQSLEYLHEPDSLFISCTTLIQWNDTRTLRRLALLHPKHDSWSGCIQRLEDSGMDGAVVAEFKAFIQAGCVGGYGEDDAPPSSSSVPSPEENEKPPQHLWLMMRYRVQQFITGKPRHGGIELLRDDHRA